MTTCSEKLTATRQYPGQESPENVLPMPHAITAAADVEKNDDQLSQLAATILTTFSIFGVYLVQGVMVARIMGAEGRGEFGTALYFPRDILLYAGLLGAIEIVVGYAARKKCDSVQLKYSAARLGFFTGALTGLVAAMLSMALLIPTGKAYLIPFAIVCCLFVPFEHIHLTISSVDRGNGAWLRYNVNRLVFAMAFPILVATAWLIDLPTILGVGWLWLMCGLFVVAKIVGLLPTLRGMGLFSSVERKKHISLFRQSRNQGSESNVNNVPGVRPLLKEGRPYALSMFVSELFERLDIFLILAIATVVESGHYFVAVPAAGMLIVAPNALGVFTFNAGAKDNVRVTLGLAIKVMLATAIFQAIATIIFSLVIGDLIVLVYTSEFAKAIPFALWLLPASAIRGFLQATDSYLKGRGKPMIGAYARAISIVVMLLFVWLVYPSQGLLSVPMAACVGQVISMLIIVPAVLCNVDKPESPLDSQMMGAVE